MSLPPSHRTALILLGSDISTFGGVLGPLGVRLPRDLMTPAAGDVPTPDHVTGLNDKILAQASVMGEDLHIVLADWLDSPEAAGLLDEAVLALTHDHGEAPAFVITDPRICRLLPFWCCALKRIGAQPLVVQIPGTAPDTVSLGTDDVADSKLRNQIKILQADHRARIVGLQADRASLIGDLRSTSEKLSHATQAADARQVEIKALSERLAGLDRRLHVASAQLRQLARQPPSEMRERLYLAIALDDPDICSESLSDLNLRVKYATARLEAERAELQRRSDQVNKQESRLVAERDAARAGGQQREAELQSSLSWRVTAPLRALSRSLQRLRGRT